MDEQADTEPVTARMRETVSQARLVETDQIAAREPFQQAEPLQPMERARMTEAEPLRRMEGVQATAPEPFQQAEPLRRMDAVQAEPLRRMEGVQATAPEPFQQAEPLRRMDAVQAEPLRRMEGVQATAPEPFQHAESTRLAARDSLAPTEATRLAARDSLAPTEATRLAEQDSLRPTEATRRSDLAPGLAATRGAAATDPDGAEAAKRRAPAAEQAPQGSGGSGGSAGTGFKVDPAQYQAAVSPVLAAADQLSQLVTGLTAFLDHTQSTAPWGNDESGKKFAEGEKGYLKYSTDTLKGLKGMPDSVRYIADGLKAMAENYQYAEDATTAVFQSDGGGSEPPTAPQVGTYSAPVNPTIPTGALGSIAQGRPSTHTTGRA
ncbi:hypothetical protein AB0K43_22280 [Kitasatospora sp. NPDC049258]|uniref:hypothetical protein n=1 Tax=Kitasatospora sp. NPDC049258 TaxID=3155394 RepID=UPI00344330F0